MKLKRSVRLMLWRWIPLTTFAFTATASPNDPGFYLGQSRAKMLSFWGQPFGAFTPKNTKVYSANKHEALRSISGTVIDAYTKRFGGNEVEVDVLYQTDYSESRLHGIERAVKIIFKPDKFQPFSELLAELPAVRHICSSGCKLRLSDDNGVLYTAALIPKEVSPKEKELAELSAKQLMPLGEPESVVPTISILFASPRHPLEEVTKASFDQLRVESVELGAESNQLVPSEGNRTAELDYIPQA